MRCDYCYNKDIVFAKSGKYSYQEILEFLKTRENLLDGVVLSGGEATMHDLYEFCIHIKEMGFKIKLDTNGTNYELVRKLIESNLIDYIALDYKAPSSKFTQITHSNKYDEFVKTLSYLCEIDFDFEVRTTLHSDLLNEDDINEIISKLKEKNYDKTYYIQNFWDTGTNIADIKEAVTIFDKSLLSDDVKTQFR